MVSLDSGFLSLFVYSFRMLTYYKFSVCITVYPDGKVCISILHPPGDDPNGYELASERWTPVHTV